MRQYQLVVVLADADQRAQRVARRAASTTSMYENTTARLRVAVEQHLARVALDLGDALGA